MTRKDKEGENYLKTAKSIICSFWTERYHITQQTDMLLTVYRVNSAEPEDLIDDYEAVIRIMKKAIQTAKKEKKSDKKG